MRQMIARIFALLVNSGAITHNVYPRSADGSAAAAVTLTAHATAWTAGSYAQIVASSVADAWLEGVTLENFVGAASQGEVEIATGGAGSEVIIATVQATAASYRWDKASFIPAGTRIAARYRTSTGAADTVDVKLNVAEGV